MRNLQLCAAVLSIAVLRAVGQACQPPCNNDQICARATNGLPDACFPMSMCPQRCQDPINCEGSFDGRTFLTRCKCEAGFVFDPPTKSCITDGRGCVTAGCPGNNEICVNLRCECATGFARDPRTFACERSVPFAPCDTQQCRNNEVCVVDTFGEGRCVCKEGFVVDSTGACVPRVPPLSEAPGLCQSSGDPHISTWNMAHYDFQERCDYVLVRTPANLGLEIHTRNGECLPSSPIATVACTKAVAFKHLTSPVVEFYENQVIIGGAVATLPATAGTVQVAAQSGGYVATLSNGVVITYQRFYVSVQAPASFKNQTKGQCGTFDDIPANDFLARNGSVLQTSLPFARSWIVQQGDPVLFSIPNPECGTIVQPGPDNCQDPAVLEAAYKNCSRIFQTPCSAFVDATKFFRDCLMDICRSQVPIPEIVAQSLHALQRKCDNDRTVTDCNPVCGPNEQCVRTAASPKGRCECKDGFIRDILTFTCRRGVIASPCDAVTPCTGANQVCEISNPGSNQGNCLCAPNFIYVPANDSCVPRTPLPSALCSAYGDPHFKTWNNRYYDFQEKCDYVLVDSATTTIHVRHGECFPQNPNGQISCVKGVGILSLGHVIEFSDVAGLVDGVATQFPVSLQNGQISITTQGVGKYRASFYDGIVVDYRPYQVNVQAPPSFQNAVRGLCGSYDDVPNNDLISRDGTIAATPSSFGQSWQVTANEPSLFSTVNSVCGKASPSSSLDCSDPAVLRIGYQNCQAILADANCLNKVDVARLFRDCVVDYCLTNGSSVAVAAAIEAATVQCQFAVNAACSITCGANEECVLVKSTGPGRFVCRCKRGYFNDFVTGQCTTGGVGAPCDDNTPCTGVSQVCVREDGSTKGTCLCADGFVYVNGVCVQRVVKPPAAPSVCWSSGDPHFSSLDSRYFDFQGRCDYVFFRATNGLEIHIRLGECFRQTPNAAVSCTKGAAFKLGANVFEFSEAAALQNGVGIAAFPVNFAGGSLTSTGLGRYTATLADGVVITFIPYYLSVQVPSTYKNGTTRGLCGPFNGDSTDDFTQRNPEMVANSAVAFGTSWAVGGNDQVLFAAANNECGQNPGPSTPALDCTDPAVLRTAFARCQAILGNNICGLTVDLSQFFRNCVFDLCAAGDQAASNALEAAAIQCQFENTTAPNCQTQCGPNEVCSFSGTRPICICKDGFTVDLTTGQCTQGVLGTPCGPNRPCTGQNMECDEEQKTCFCKPGFSFVNGACVPLPPKPDDSAALCYASGDPHYHSADSRWFDWQPFCDYVLVTGNGVDIHIRHGLCPGFGTSVSCTTGIAFSYNGRKFEFSSTGALIDGTATNTFPSTVSGVSLTSTSVGNYVATLPDGLVITFRPFYASVALPPSYRNSIRGLCGNFDGVAANDFQLRDGSLGALAAFGSDWQVGGSDPQIFSSGNQLCRVNPNPVPPTVNCEDPAVLRLAYEKCRAILNSPCATRFDVSRSFRDCVFDYCNSNGTTTFAIDAFNLHCNFETTSVPQCPTCGPNEECKLFGNPPNQRAKCVCREGFFNDPVTLRCRNNGIFAPCDPATNRGCGENQICELLNQFAICLCKDGFVFNRTTGRCDPVSPPPVSTAICSSFGDPHLSIWSSRTYDLQERCDFVLVRNPTNRVEIQVRHGECSDNFPRPQVSCVRAIAIRTNEGKIVEFYENDARVDGSAVATFPSAVGTAALTSTGVGAYQLNLADGLIIKYSRFYVSVQAPASYKNNVGGLCGPWDDVLNNDFTGRDGIVYGNAVPFGQTWGLDAPNSGNLFSVPSQCTTGTPSGNQTGPGRDCSDPDVLAEGFKRCNSTLFHNCAKVLDSARYLFHCLYDYCLIGDVVRDAVELSLDAFRKRCEYESNTTGCTLQCPANQICRVKLGQQFCDCLDGFFRDPKTFECVRQGGSVSPCDPKVLPCRANETCVVDPVTNTGRCICKEGFVLNSQKICVPRVPDPPVSPAQCQIYGDPHYSTFNQALFHFMDRCDYVLVKTANPALEIHGRNGECSPQHPRPQVSCLLGLAFKTAQGQIVEFGSTSVLVNNAAVTTFPSTLPDGTVISNTAGTFSALLADGSQIQYSNQYGIIKLVSLYKTKTAGLCGTWDDIANNDFRARNGSVLGSESFADSWQVTSPTDSTLFQTPNPECGNRKREVAARQILGGPNCEDPQVLQMAYSACNLTADDACTSKVDISQFVVSCIYDYCALSDGVPDIAKFATKALADSCKFQQEIASSLQSNSREGTTVELSSASLVTASIATLLALIL